MNCIPEATNGKITAKHVLNMMCRDDPGHLEGVLKLLHWQSEERGVFLN
jgi:hypothetical protein